MKSNLALFHVSQEVKQALGENKPVLALESTIISHGMPYPENVETALAVEDIVRQQGVIPATMALMDGKFCVGLSHADIKRLGTAKGVSKVSIRDIPLVLAQKGLGATTVATTMRMAAMVGIKLFATGGIGGVHRGAETTMDISADLTEMGKTSVAVVSAGVKSILDIGLTLEFLETLGVPVVTFGQSEFPSFYSSKSKFYSPIRLDTEAELAQLLHLKWTAGLEGSVLIANPVPETFAYPEEEIEGIIRQALALADVNNVAGKDITPFLLRHIATQTGGESLKSNIALIKNNALLGARIAKAYSALQPNSTTC
jgi:pseudouridine-5'-phosphate glycosidase